jgi:hypothetical protein
VQARRMLWRAWSDKPFLALTPPHARCWALPSLGLGIGGARPELLTAPPPYSYHRFGHLGTTAEQMEMMTLRMPEFAEAYQLKRHACCWAGPAARCAAAVVINSLLDSSGDIGKGERSLS